MRSRKKNAKRTRFENCGPSTVKQKVKRTAIVSGICLNESSKHINAFRLKKAQNT